MSYPGQPPMGIPGMPPMPYMVGAPPPIIGGVMPMAHVSKYKIKYSKIWACLFCMLLLNLWSPVTNRLHLLSIKFSMVSIKKLIILLTKTLIQSNVT